MIAEGKTLISNMRLYLAVILIVSLVPMVGCNSVTLMGNPDNGALNDPGGDGASGPDAGGGDSDLGDGEEPDPVTNEPSDPGSENPPDARPEEPPEPSDEALPDFLVVDVNAESARYQESVSPRDYLGQISAWYFGHST